MNPGESIDSCLAEVPAREIRAAPRAIVCYRDELLQRYIPEVVSKRLEGSFSGKTNASMKIAGIAIALAQKRAERQASRQRASVLKMDTWLEEALSFAGNNSL